MSGDIFLKVEDLNIWFDPKQKVVDQVSFTIHKGEVFSLVGESGSGKTLTCLSLCRLLPEAAGYSGKVLLEGKTDILGLSEEKIRDLRGGTISYIFQESLASLNPFLTVGYQIEEALIFHKGLSKKEAFKQSLRSLSGVKFSDPQRIHSSFPHQISGGEAQRAMIAMALACEPKLLVCDEPTSNLDVTIQMQIIELLNEKRRELGFSLLFVTHDLSLVEHFSDRAAVISRGSIVEQANTKELFSNPKNQYTKALIEASFKIA